MDTAKQSQNHTNMLVPRPVDYGLFAIALLAAVEVMYRFPIPRGSFRYATLFAFVFLTLIRGDKTSLVKANGAI